MDDVTDKLVSLSSEHLMKAAFLDAEIGMDYLKYSAWCSALATAGIGLALSNWEKIAAGFPRPGLALATVTVALVASIVFGARVNWNLNAYSTACREVWSLVSIQQIALHISNPPEKGSELVEKFWAGGYLDQAQQKTWKESRKKDADDIKSLLLWQQVAAIAGYATAIGVALWRYAAA